MASARHPFGPYEEGEQSLCDYIEQFDQYVLANQIPEERQRAVFLSSLGPKAYATLRSLTAPDKPADRTLSALKQLLGDHLSPPPLEIAATYRFHCRRQTEGEEVKEFVAHLRTLATPCNFGAFLARALRDRFVSGLACDETRRKLLAVANLTLEQAVSIAMANEASSKEAKNMANSRELPADRVGYSPRAQSQTRCDSCGLASHERRDCPHLYSTCHGCGRRGHIRTVCRSNKGRSATPKSKQASTKAAPAHQLDSHAESGADEEEIRVYAILPSTQQPCMVSVTVEGHPLDMEFDTGSSISTISLHKYKSICPGMQLEPTNVVLRPYGVADKITPLGVIRPNITFKGQTRRARVFVLQEANIPLFGREWMNLFGIEISTALSSHALADQQFIAPDVTAILKTHGELFSDSLEHQDHPPNETVAPSSGDISGTATPEQPPAILEPQAQTTERYYPNAAAGETISPASDVEQPIQHGGDNALPREQSLASGRRISGRVLKGQPPAHLKDFYL